MCQKRRQIDVCKRFHKIQFSIQICPKPKFEFFVVSHECSDLQKPVKKNKDLDINQGLLLR